MRIHRFLPAILIAQFLPISGSAQTALPKIGTRFTYAYEWSYSWWNHAESRKDTVTHELTSVLSSGDTTLLHFKVIKGRDSRMEFTYKSYVDPQLHSILASEYPSPVKITDRNQAYLYDLTSAEDTSLLIQGNMIAGELSRSGSSAAIYVPSISWLATREGMTMVMEDQTGVPATERWSYRLLDDSTPSGVSVQSPSPGLWIMGNQCLINSAPGEVLSITILDILGRKIYAEKYIISSTTQEVEIPALPHGCYLALVNVGRETQSIKFVK